MKVQGDFKVYLLAYHDEVTGTRLMLVIIFPDGREYRILIDCGYFQEVEYRYLNYIDDLDPNTIDAILVTHNHIDHTGLIPKLVRNGYRNPIYMTEITKILLPKFLADACERQKDNAKYLKDKYPDESWKFNELYYPEDVKHTLNLCNGVKFRKTIEIFPGVKVTFFINGHILGAAMILVQCTAEGRKPINFLFTGDYKLRNQFFTVPQLPDWLKNMELIMVHESTNGALKLENIKVCFIRNLLEGFKRNQNILIGASAQGRMQEVLYDLRKLQDANLIPENYEIYVDGALGIDTNYKYQKILNWFNPSAGDFMPKDLKKVEPKCRESILDFGGPKIVVTTSGMLSNGPAKVYVPIFLERHDALIHLTGYAAEETLARTLLEAKRADSVKIDGKQYQKNAFVKTTREKTSHVTLDESLDFINQFNNIVFLGLNHGSVDAQENMKSAVLENCKNVNMIDVLNRNCMYCFSQKATLEEQSRIQVKKMPAKMHAYSPDNNENIKKQKQKKRDKKAHKNLTNESSEFKKTQRNVIKRSNEPKKTRMNSTKRNKSKKNK